MNDSSPVQTGHTKKTSIPSSHLEHHYIHQCTDGLELEQIYKELKYENQEFMRFLMDFYLIEIEKKIHLQFWSNLHLIE